MRSLLQITLVALIVIMIFGNVSIFAQAPTIVSTSPTQNELNCSISTSISVTFFIDMDATTINNSSFVVNSTTTGLHQGTFSYDITTRTVTFDPSNDFDAGEVVSVVLTTGIQSSTSVPLSKSYIWSFTINVPYGGGEFELDSTYRVGVKPLGVITADIDNDGDQDLIIANKDSDNITVLLGIGDGTFSFYSHYYAGNGPEGLCAADFNRDSNIDIAVVNKWSDNVYILRGNGGGVFHSHSSRVVGGNPYSVFPGDFDGDGDIDLATANSGSDNVSVILNDGNGYFSSPIKYNVGEFPYTITGGDLDGDGDIDLTNTNRVDDNVSVLLNNGNGTFSSQITYAVGDMPVSVFLADFDNDGDIDLTTGNAADNNISILLNNGNGTFPVQNVYSTGDGPNFIYAGDYDGDGDIDVATSNVISDDISIILNNGDGTFADDITFSVGDGYRDIYSSDLDNDGDIDIVIIHLQNRRVAVLLNNVYFGSILGFISSNSTGYYGVPVDIYDGDGTLIGSSVSDENGWYEFDSHAFGNYMIAISTPLGYQADAEIKGVYLGGLLEEVNFDLTMLDIPMSQRGRGYWMHQVNALLSGKGKLHESYDDMCTHMELIRTHFNEHGINPITVYNVDLNSDCDQRLEALRAVIAPIKKATMVDKAKAHLTTLLLNMVSGKIAQWAEISEDNSTVSQAITYCYNLISDSDLENDELSKDIAEMINEGNLVPTGWIDLTTPEYLYKNINTEQLPSEYLLSQNYPNPFNPTTVISFSLPVASDVKLEILNINGQKVATLANTRYEVGIHSVSWNAKDVANGVYLYRLDAGDFVDSKKMILLK